MESISQLKLQLQSAKQEWQICEDLLAESQSDNQRKHQVMEAQNRYIRDLERLLHENLGPSWKIDHKIESLQVPTATSVSFNAATPLPKESLRHSTSLSVFSSQRNSVRLVSRAIPSSNRLLLAELGGSENEADSTPTGALRRLQCQTKPVDVRKNLEPPKETALREASIPPSSSKGAGTRVLGNTDERTARRLLGSTIPKTSKTATTSQSIEELKAAISDLARRLDQREEAGPRAVDGDIKCKIDLVCELKDMEQRSIKREKELRNLVHEVKSKRSSVNC